MEKFLVSADFIAYLKWLVYVAAFKDGGNVNHVAFYNKEVVFLNHLKTRQWRGLLCNALNAWYAEFKPSNKCNGKSSCSGPAGPRRLLSMLTGFSSQT